MGNLGELFATLLAPHDMMVDQSSASFLKCNSVVKRGNGNYLIKGGF